MNSHDFLEKVSHVKVLVVDDDVDIIESIKYELSFLLGDSFSVTEAFDGRAGWAVCEKTKFDVIITDYNMPMLNGIEFLEKIREKVGLNSETPTIFLSGMKPELKKDGYFWDNVFFMEKPWKARQMEFIFKVCLKAKADKVV